MRITHEYIQNQRAWVSLFAPPRSSNLRVLMIQEVAETKRVAAPLKVSEKEFNSDAFSKPPDHTFR